MILIAGSHCDALEGPAAARLHGRNNLEEWVLDESLPRNQRRLAGEALLRDHASTAATLRAQLSADEEWMLTPFIDRRVEMVVEEDVPSDSAPELVEPAMEEELPSSQARIINNNPAEPSMSAGAGVVVDDTAGVQSISSACAARVAIGWNINTSGDDYVASWINYYAWFNGESCSVLRTRYDSDVTLQNNTWDEGLGWNSVCDDRKPLKRAINSLFVLENASSTPNSPGNYSGGVIHWAWDYIKKKTPEFEGSCDEDVTARYFPGGWFSDRKIELKLPLWNGSVAERASIILHEARHAGGYSHNGGSGCPAGASCDSSYSYAGANTRQIQWLSQYYRVGNIASAALRVSALGYANLLLANYYSQCPNVQLDGNGYFYSVPNLCH